MTPTLRSVQPPLATNKVDLLLRPLQRRRSIVMCMSLCVCLSVCLFGRISPEPHARYLPNFLRMLPMSVARSSCGILTIGRIACRREGGDGSAQRGRSVIYDCLVLLCFLQSDCIRREPDSQCTSGTRPTADRIVLHVGKSVTARAGNGSVTHDPVTHTESDL